MGRSQTETKALIKAIEKRRKAGRANFGTIDLLPSGRLRARYVGPDERRHNAPHTFDTLVDADAYLLTIRQQIAAGAWLSPAEQQRADRVAAISGTTANTLFEDYLEEGDLKQGTIDLYRYQWHRFIEPSIGAQAVAELTATDVADWRAQLPPGSRQREQTEDLLRAVLGLAIERRLINFNPAARTRRKRKGRNTRAKARDTILLSPAEVAALAKAMPPERSFAVLISAWCGLRQGEMFALRRSDLNISETTTATSAPPRCSSPGPWSGPNNPTARSWRSKTTPNPTPGSAASRSHPTSSATSTTTSTGSPRPEKRAAVPQHQRRIPPPQHPLRRTTRNQTPRQPPRQPLQRIRLLPRPRRHRPTQPDLACAAAPRRHPRRLRRSHPSRTPRTLRPLLHRQLRHLPTRRPRTRPPNRPTHVPTRTPTTRVTRPHLAAKHPHTRSVRRLKVRHSAENAAQHTAPRSATR